MSLGERIDMLKRIKDKLYYYFAEKNWGVRREYGPYVNAHQEEHAKKPWKHWWLLVKLNWHYRVLRRETQLLELRVKKRMIKTGGFHIWMGQSLRFRSVHCRFTW